MSFFDSSIGSTILAGAPVQQTSQDIAIKNAQANNLNAQTPGIQGLAQQQQFAAQKQQDIANVFRANTTTNPDGTQTVNTNAIPAALAGAGYGQDAIDYFKNSQQATQAQIKTDDDARVFKNNLFNTAATTASALEAQQPGAGVAFMNKATNIDQGAFPDLKSVIGDDPRFHQTFTTPNQVAAMASATMDPEAQAKLAISQKQQQLQFAQAAYDPSAQDPLSDVNQAAGALARQAGLPWPADMTVMKANQIPGYATALGIGASSGIIPSTARVPAFQDVQSKQATLGQLDTGIQAATALGPNLINNKLGSIGSAAWNKYVESNPQLAAVTTAVQLHNSMFPNDQIDTGKLSPAEIVAKLQVDKANVGAAQAGSAAIAGSSIIPPNGQAPAKPAQVQSTQLTAPGGNAPQSSTQSQSGALTPAQISAKRAGAHEAIMRGASPAAVAAKFKQVTGQDL